MLGQSGMVWSGKLELEKCEVIDVAVKKLKGNMFKSIITYFVLFKKLSSFNKFEIITILIFV